MDNLPDKNILPNVSGLIKAGNNRYIKPINNGMVFYSYSTPVIVILESRVYKTAEFYSITTSKHINQFLRDIGCDNPEIVNQELINNLSNN